MAREEVKLRGGPDAGIDNVGGLAVSGLIETRELQMDERAIGFQAELLRTGERPQPEAVGAMLATAGPLLETEPQVGPRSGDGERARQPTHGATGPAGAVGELRGSC